MRQKNREMKWGKSCSAFKLAAGTRNLVTSIKTEVLASFCQNHSWAALFMWYHIWTDFTA